MESDCFIPPPDDLLGEDRFSAVMFPLDEGEGIEGDAGIELLVDLRLPGRENGLRLPPRLDRDILVCHLPALSTPRVRIYAESYTPFAVVTFTQVGDPFRGS